LYQGVKRKQALLGSNLSAISALTVCNDAILGGGYSASFFVLLTLSIWLRKPNVNPVVNRLSTTDCSLLGRAANSFISLV
jgi:hypothetical protein